ncbi:MAG: chemotaxis protein CheD [Pseudomonadales bacterium]
MDSQIVDIHIGEIQLAKPQEQLRALLGSCVGIALINRKRQQCTLCHCLLPNAPAIVDEIGARWVDQAIHSALMLLNAERVGRRYLEAVVAGGGRVVSHSGASKIRVGESNIAAAREVLGSYRIPIVDEDVGGCQSRQILVCGSTLEHQINRIPKIGQGAA